MAKYLKRDSEKGFVEDYAEIQSLKFNNVRHTVLGGMLGDYDDQGYYRVHPDIVQELIEMPKYVVEVMDNLEICLSAFKLDKQISFLVAYEGEKATLSLLEKVSFEANNKLDSGTWSNVNEFILDTVETVGEIDRQALYIKWNIQTFPGQIIDIFNCDESVLAKYFNIVTRFKFNLEAKTTLLKKEEELEEIEAEYFLDLFDILKDYPELKTAVEKQIKQNLLEKKDFLKLDRPNFAKTLNEVVEKAIEDNVAILPENQQESFKAQKRNITIKANVKKYDAIPIVAEKVEKLNEAKQIEEIQEVDSNIEPITNGRTVTNKLQAEDVRYKSLGSVAADYVKAEKETMKKAEENAQNCLLGKTSRKIAQVVDAIVKTGVAATTIISSPAIAAIAGKQTAEKAVDKTVDSAQKAIEKVTAPEKKAEQKKPEAKKPEKKKEEKKKQEKKKEEKKKPETKKPEAKKPEKKKEEKSKSVSGTSSVGGGVSSVKTQSSQHSAKTEEEKRRESIIGRSLRAEKDLNSKKINKDNNRLVIRRFDQTKLDEERSDLANVPMQTEEPKITISRKQGVGRGKNTISIGKDSAKIIKEDELRL